MFQNMARDEKKNILGVRVNLEEANNVYDVGQTWRRIPVGQS